MLGFLIAYLRRTSQYFSESGINEKTVPGAIFTFYAVGFRAFVYYVLSLYLFCNFLLLPVFHLFSGFVYEPLSLLESFFLSCCVEVAYFLLDQAIGFWQGLSSTDDEK